MKQQFKKIEGDSSFIRDMTNKALINTDNQALLAYKKRKHASDSLQQDVSNLKKEMLEIKSLLIKLLDK